MCSFDAEEQRTVIKLCVSLNKTPTQTKEMLQSATTKASMCILLVYKWHKRFSDGSNNNKDDDRSGRPKIADDAILTSVNV